MTEETNAFENMLYSEPEAPTEDKLNYISRLAEEQVKTQEEIANLENQIAAKQEKLKKISEYSLPEAMSEVGMKSFTLKDGTKLSIQQVYSASISEDRKPHAHNWLRNSGFADLIKNEVKVSFGKKEDDKARELMTQLRSMGLMPKNTESVHYQTLKAFVKEQMEQGALSVEAQKLLGVYVCQVAKIGKK